MWCIQECTPLLAVTLWVSNILLGPISLSSFRSLAKWHWIPQKHPLLKPLRSFFLPDRSTTTELLQACFKAQNLWFRSGSGLSWPSTLIVFSNTKCLFVTFDQNAVKEGRRAVDTFATSTTSATSRRTTAITLCYARDVSCHVMSSLPTSVWFLFWVPPDVGLAQVPLGASLSTPLRLRTPPKKEREGGEGRAVAWGKGPPAATGRWGALQRAVGARPTSGGSRFLVKEITSRDTCLQCWENAAPLEPRPEPGKSKVARKWLQSNFRVFPEVDQ